MRVQGAVGELDTMERHRLPHPVGAGSGGVGVNVDTVRQARLGFAAGLPAPALPTVASSVHWHHIQKEQVAGLGVQASDGHSTSREHASGWERRRASLSYPAAISRHSTDKEAEPPAQLALEWRRVGPGSCVIPFYRRAT